MGWQFIVDIGIISVGFLIATFLRVKLTFLQKYLIPNSLTAGFLLLLFYNLAAPFFNLGTKGLTDLIYHLLNISFIAMCLQKSDETASNKKAIFQNCVTLMSHYTLQCVVGLGLTFLLIFTFIPDLFPSFGLHITLGFCLGPGQAFAIGKAWEKLGFLNGGNIGLTFAAFGFICACFIGITLTNIGIKKGWVDKKTKAILKSKNRRPGLLKRGEANNVNVPVITEIEAIDPMTYNVIIIFGVYLITFLFLNGLEFVLSSIGPKGKDLAASFWGISFIFSGLIAILSKKVLQKARIDYTIENWSMQRITGISVDFMVAASIGAISFVVIGQYWVPIVIMVFVGALTTTILCIWMSSRIFNDFVFHRMLIMFGAVTGTLPTGLALLRIIDPNFETPVARDYIYGTGTWFAFSIPLILTINLPAYGYLYSNPIYYWWTAAVFLVYVIASIVSYRLITGKNAFNNFFSLWGNSKIR